MAVNILYSETFSRRGNSQEAGKSPMAMLRSPKQP
jgi:hypothetical protein